MSMTEVNNLKWVLVKSGKKKRLICFPENQQKPVIITGYGKK